MNESSFLLKPITFSAFSELDSDRNTDPNSGFWLNAPAISASHDTFSNLVPECKTEIRSRWSAQNLYFLFICAYDELSLRPNPNTISETFELWNWDVAEVFIGSDFQKIRRYKEFEVSPQGEWVDLDVDLDEPHPEEGWVWESGCEVAARIDEESKIWYGFMRIPYSAVDDKPAAAGNLLRVNFFRCQGVQPNHKEISWQPTNNLSFHVPEAFGILKLI